MMMMITVLLFYSNPCDNLLRMFSKHDFKLEICKAICWSYLKLRILIVMGNTSLFNPSGKSLDFSPVK